MNFTSGLIFYPILGLFSINILENTHEVTSFILHDTISMTNHVRGNSIVLENANIGVVLFGLQVRYSGKIKLAWSAGTYTKIIKKSRGIIYIQLPSSLIYGVPEVCMGTVGLSAKKILRKLTKAGESRYILKVPIVWGIAMNPVDHPHGGRTNKGCHPVTPSGFLTKGVWTRKSNIWSNNKIYAPRIKQL